VRSSEEYAQEIGWTFVSRNEADRWNTVRRNIFHWKGIQTSQVSETCEVFNPAPAALA